MKVEVDLPVGQFVQTALMEDWDMINLDIKMMKGLKSIRKLEEFEKEDLKNWKRIRKALKVMIRYYFPYEESKVILGK